MSEQYYINQIYNKRNRLEEVEREIIKWNGKRTDLNSFLRKHTETIQQVEGYFQNRRDKINKASIDENQVKVFKKYKVSMLNDLNGNENRNIISKKYEESQYIKNKIIEVEDLISQLQRERQALEQSISNLNYERREERYQNGK